MAVKGGQQRQVFYTLTLKVVGKGGSSADGYRLVYTTITKEKLGGESPAG